MVRRGVPEAPAPPRRATGAESGANPDTALPSQAAGGGSAGAAGGGGRGWWCFPPRRPPASRLLTAAVLGVAGFLGVTSVVNAAGTDLRPERQTDVAGYVRSQVQRNEALAQQVSRLRGEVDTLTGRVSDEQVRRAQRRAAALAPAAGLTAVRGPGVVVTLDDAPAAERSADVDPDALIVHQQDIQAVVNALWAGGAEAVAIQGQRIISTSAIRCVGNSVVLHGVPYPPPYRIQAIGDQAAMLTALGEAPAVRTYLDYVARFHLGYDLHRSARLELPAFTGSLDLPHAAAGTD